MIVDIMDVNFDQIDLKRNYDHSRYNRGKRLYNNECVEIKNVDKIIDEKNETYKIEAVVEGNYDYYDVEVNIENETLKSYSCSCPDASGKKMCKHVIATCMEAVNPHFPSTKERIEEENKKREEEHKRYIEEQKRIAEERQRRYEYEKKYKNALNILEKYKIKNQSLLEENNDINVEKLYEYVSATANLTSNAELNTNIKIEPKIEVSYYSTLDVTFKIGQTTMYSLKDLATFSKAFKSGEILEYGKKLKFEAKRENFNESSRGLLDYIIKYGEMLTLQKELMSRTYYSFGSSTYKTIQLHEEDLDEFFSLLKGRIVEFSSYSNGIEQFIFTDEKLDLRVNVQKHETGERTLSLNQDISRNYKSKKNIYVLDASKIYSLERTNKLDTLIELFSYDSEILIPNDKISEFSTYILPQIDEFILDEQLDYNEDKEDDDINEDSGENVPKIDSKNDLVVNKLASKAFLDLDAKNNITLTLKFCYLDSEFNILDPNHKKYVDENNITRNLSAERDVLKRLFLDGFEIEPKKDYFVLKNPDFVYDFLSEKIEGYMNDFEVLATDKFKTKKIKKTKITNVGVKVDGGLLQVDMSNMDIDMDEMKKVIQSYNLKKKYYKLKNGDFIDLEKSEDLDFLNEMTTSLDVDFNKIDKGVIKLPVNRSLYLEKLLNNNKNIAVETNKEYNKIVDNITNPNLGSEIAVSKSFDKVLRSYQKTGYKWLKVLEKYGFGGVLADDMGLGKTLQVIALLEAYIKTKNHLTSIVVCPSSLVLNWKAEVEKWCKKINVLVISGDAKTRKDLISQYNNYDLVITSYDLLKRDVVEYEGKKFKYVIADEAQYIKNSTTQNATSLKSLEGEARFALTGTPIENSISELWSIFDFVMPGYLYNYNKFKKKFEQPITAGEDKESLKRLKTMIEPFVLRRVKSEVLTELPDKNITIMKSQMTKEQEKIYFAYLSQIKQEVSEELNQNGFEKSKLKILMLLTRLRQICCHPSLFLEDYKGESGKLSQCMDVLNEAVESGHKVLLFSQYTSMFEILEEELKKLNINYFKLTGSTPVSKRIEMVDKFNKDSNVKVFLISLKAGGTGLNLTGADVVIHYDPWWNLSSENQATDRAYRIGQKNSVQVYKFITVNSIEEKINKLQEKKAKLSEELLSTEETFINKLSKEEIMALFE